MSNLPFGRHRAPGHLNPAPSLSSAISRSAKPATIASALIAISGAMVAALALPASAAPMATNVKTAAPLSAPSAAQAPSTSRLFGIVGFTGVDKPPPVAAPVVAAPVVRAPVRVERTVERVSRSATRSPVSAPAPKPPASRPVAPAPRRAAPAPAKKAPVAAPRSGVVLGIAASLSGIAYVYGGTTPAGFDCSGFTQYVFNKVGINLPRTAEQQRQFATPVSNPQPGDLVFFGAPAHHMGIYAGNGMIWDSPRTGKSISKRAIWTTSGVTYGRV